ncbi:hypothetical protein [uncultured Desulfobacter sp.]|nr:hypothetical protein [uncultured Desulfobacter sp.]
MDDILSTHALASSHAVTLGTTLKTANMCFPKVFEKADLSHWMDRLFLI